MLSCFLSSETRKKFFFSYITLKMLNLWAVKVHGSQQESDELTQIHGFSYDKHVGVTLVKASLLSPSFMLRFALATSLCLTHITPQLTTR